jgi:hypothetical protein
MIGNNFALTSRDAWTMIPGNSISCINDENGNPTQIIFYSNNEIIFVQSLTYDSKKAVTSIICTSTIPE